MLPDHCVLPITPYLSKPKLCACAPPSVTSWFLLLLSSLPSLTLSYLLAAGRGNRHVWPSTGREKASSHGDVGAAGGKRARDVSSHVHLFEEGEVWRLFWLLARVQALSRLYCLLGNPYPFLNFLGEHFCSLKCLRESGFLGIWAS